MTKRKVISLLTLIMAVTMVIFCFFGDRVEVYNTINELFVLKTVQPYEYNGMYTFTFINSFFTGTVGALLIPVSIYQLCKDSVSLKWVGLIKTIASATNVFVFTGTFFGLVIMAIYQRDFVAAWDYTFAGGGFFTHFLNPILVLVIFFISFDEINVSHTSFLFVVIPSLAYFIIYFIFVFGFNTWWDIYALKDVVKVVGDLFGSPAFGVITVGLIYLIVNWYVVAMYQLFLVARKKITYVNGVPLTEILEKKKQARASK